jgi:hypothetical protein
MQIEDIGNIKWRTANGQTLRIKDMEIGHLVNSINWVYKHQRDFDPSLHGYLEEYAKHISYFLFCDRKPYPYKKDNKWYIFDTTSGKLTHEKPPAEYIEYIKEHESDNPRFKHYFK